MDGNSLKDLAKKRILGNLVVACFFEQLNSIKTQLDADIQEIVYCV